MVELVKYGAQVAGAFREVGRQLEAFGNSNNVDRGLRPNHYPQSDSDREVGERIQREREAGGTREQETVTPRRNGQVSLRVRSDQEIRIGIEVVEVRLSPTALPMFCRQHWKEKGCTKKTCQELHLCRLSLAGICKFGDKCKKSHSLHSAHNKVGTRGS